MEIRSAEFIKGVMGTDALLYDGTPQIAFVGRSNVGKSSVLNSLVGQKGLAREGKKPGKTTEMNIFSINKGQSYFIDLPGYGYAKVSPEMKEKIVRLINWYINDSGIKPLKIVLILDIKAGLTNFDQETIAMLEQNNHPYILVANKIDKLNKKELAEKMSLIREKANKGNVIEYSAEQKIGVKTLLKELY